MSPYLKVALWVFLSSALVALANAWVGIAYTEYWGGTNFLAGGIQLVAYAGMAVGAGFFVAAIVRKRRESSRSR
jgi:hypothetical protein